MSNFNCTRKVHLKIRARPFCSALLQHTLTFPNFNVKSFIWSNFIYFYTDGVWAAENFQHCVFSAEVMFPLMDCQPIFKGFKRFQVLKCLPANSSILCLGGTAGVSDFECQLQTVPLEDRLQKASCIPVWKKVKNDLWKSTGADFNNRLLVNEKDGSFLSVAFCYMIDVGNAIIYHPPWT